MIKTEKNIVIKTGKGHRLLADACYSEQTRNLPLIIFAHGYKGYKDWGAFDLLAEYFAGQGFLFVKFNFSHNGTTLHSPNSFDDLEAFGRNNFSLELNDYRSVTDYFIKHTHASGQVFLMGHSRGGGISLIEAHEDCRVSALALLASVSNFEQRFPQKEKMAEWQRAGVFFSENKRTKQQMPHFYQFYLDFKENEDRFNLRSAAQHFNRPLMIVHGSEDEAVRVQEAHLLHEWAKGSELLILEGAGHTFGALEPWTKPQLPPDLERAAENISAFFKKYVLKESSSEGSRK